MLYNVVWLNTYINTWAHFSQVIFYFGSAIKSKPIEYVQRRKAAREYLHTDTHNMRVEKDYDKKDSVIYTLVAGYLDMNDENGYTHF